MKKLNKIIFGTVLGLISVSAFAQHYGQPNIHQRQYNQERRIEQGIRSGELNRREVRQLDRGQRRIEMMKRRAMADGVMTWQERRAIKDEQRRQSDRIYNKKHNYR